MTPGGTAAHCLRPACRAHPVERGVGAIRLSRGLFLKAPGLFQGLWGLSEGFRGGRRCLPRASGGGPLPSEGFRAGRIQRPSGPDRGRTADPWGGPVQPGP
ncbi:hypothetical protein GCM10010327_11320 [Streptomyces nitrosporeus]|nr:hypothetical protein GCM10010327_11320 [Streptomyces nitrosporeus]